MGCRVCTHGRRDELTARVVMWVAVRAGLARERKKCLVDGGRLAGRFAAPNARAGDQGVGATRKI